MFTRLALTAITLVMAVTSVASAETSSIWTETAPVDGLALYVGHARWVHFHGAWYRANGGLERSVDGATWQAIAGSPRASNIDVTPVALFASSGRQYWRSEDGEHWNVVTVGVPHAAGLQGDRALLVATAGTSKGFRCSSDGGLTWTTPGRGWVTADSVYGVAVGEGVAWISFLTDPDVVTLRSSDGCRTWTTVARGRYVRAIAPGVLVENASNNTEVSFDGGKRWVRSPFHDPSGVLTSVATPMGYLHTSGGDAWFITATGNRRVSFDGIDLKGLHEPIGYATADHVYIFGDAGGRPRVFRAAVTALASLPIAK